MSQSTSTQHTIIIITIIITHIIIHLLLSLCISHSYTYMYTYLHVCVLFSLDNDECGLGIDNCVQICTNTAGSFYCGCNTGFQLNSDGATCNGEYYKKHTLCSYKET